jgi:hypothetical protein
VARFLTEYFAVWTYGTGATTPSCSAYAKKCAEVPTESEFLNVASQIVSQAEKDTKVGGSISPQGEVVLEAMLT